MRRRRKSLRVFGGLIRPALIADGAVVAGIVAVEPAQNRCL
jgi:hypothetical protein